MSQFRILPWQHALLVQLYGRERADRAVRLINGKEPRDGEITWLGPMPGIPADAEVTIGWGPITHLDFVPECRAKRHQGDRPRARWWLPGHGCGDSLLCGECMEKTRQVVDARVLCSGCGTVFDGLIAFAGKPKLI